jgi:peptidoglycan/xylan/chitin deacetylase (PgdA/CDA1 family)
MNRRRLLGLVGATAAGVVLDACASTRSGAATTPPISPAPLPTERTTARATTPPNTPTAGPRQPERTTAASTVATTTSPPGWAPGQPAVYVDHGPPQTSAIALTFHFGGERRVVIKLLDLLKANGVAATLFAIGEWITANPDLGHRALADGHELGNHTLHHLDMPKLDRATAHAEIEGGAQALVPFIGGIGRWFRPSGTVVPGQIVLDEAGRVGYPMSVGYDIDSTDNTEPGSRRVIDLVTGALHPGAIVSLHFGHQGTIDALPTILDRAAAAALRPVTISTLLA